MQTQDDLLIYERYQQSQQLNEVLGTAAALGAGAAGLLAAPVAKAMGYRYSPWERLKSKFGSGAAQGRVEVEKQANELVGQLKSDATKAGFKDHKDASKDSQWFTGWLTNNLGIQFKGNQTVEKLISLKKDPFLVIKTAIEQANRAQAYAGSQQQTQAQQPQVQQPQVQQPQAQQPQVQQPQVQQQRGWASKDAKRIINQIKGLDPNEQLYIVQNLSRP